eukprot:TRINITY_DN38357_c0_g1_i1.p1 TRINITY_DN38357_c0_g1~~TRINITY_DN38357_c0_g1_i1.p1  ORF type:complete len:279 (-),score=63.25 TRINITY_DN38357_c0_g1_i1:34-840(-)
MVTLEGVTVPAASRMLRGRNDTSRTKRHACLAASMLLCLGVLQLPRPSDRLHDQLAFARRHIFPFDLRSLQERIKEGTIPDELQAQMLARLETAYDKEILKWAKRHKWQKALGFLQEMHESPCKPGVKAYSAAIVACANRRWSLALDLFRQIEEQNMSPDTNAFHQLIHVFGKTKKYEHALGLLGDMQRREIPPDKALLRSALSYCRQGGLWAHAIAIIEDMDRYTMDPMAVEFNEAMDACFAAHEDDWFDVMEDKAAERGYAISLRM